MPNQNLPANVDELLQFISMNVNSDGYDKQLAPVLKQIPPQYYLQSTSDNRDPLDLLDQTIFSLPYTYFLAARCQADRPNTARLIQYILQFLTVFDANQVRLIPDKFLQVAQGLCRLATLYGNGNSVIAIKPLANAIQRYALTPNHLTNLHQMFVKECLLLKCYKQALPILQNDITEIDVQSTAISYTDHLLYHYYGAMIYIGLKNYERALYFLKLVISAPANVTSQIQIEAYKKFTLVSLLLHGKIAQLPKYTANVVFRSVKNQCQAYQDYASAFESLNVKRLRNEFNKWTDAFRKDKNLGLAKQTLDAIYRRNIQQLTQTYLTLSLADIADAVGLEGHDAPKMAESYVLRMIESREIFATISHSHQNGMVSFHDNPDRYDTSLTITQLEEQINKATTVSERVIKTDRIVGCSKEYLQKSQHILAGGAIPGGLGPGDDPDFLGGGGGYENFIDDGNYFS
ncbi:PCI-domain-containing protein [Rhizophagus irregularis]|nr:PCI-domain-containing protein [Rhizophagus irregularis]